MCHCSSTAITYAITCLDIHSLDIKHAFFSRQRNIDTELYVKPPSEFDNRDIWKLIKQLMVLKIFQGRCISELKDFIKLRTQISPYFTLLSGDKSKKSKKSILTCQY